MECWHLKKKFLIYCFLFFSFKAIGQVNHQTELINAIHAENIKFLEENVDSSNVNLVISDKGSLLLEAIDFNSTKVVQLLLSKNANPNFVFHSRTPLMYAVQKQNVNIVRLLLNSGALINAKDSINNTALMIASTGAKLNVVKLLIRRGASLNNRNSKGQNARDFAIRSNNRAIAAYLRNTFEKNLPNYFDGPYVTYLSQKKIKVIYLKHDSLKHRSDVFHKKFKLRDLNNEFHGFAGDTNTYPIIQRFQRPPTELSNLKKIIIIGDVHGQYDTLRLFLQNNKVIDKDLHWIFGTGTLLFMGDIFDRGEKVTEALWLIYKLELEAAEKGGMVYLLRGNHELMAFQEDERYLSEKYFYLFRDVKLNYPKYYNSKTLMGKWLRSKNTLVKIDSIIFVHGGIHPDLLQYNLSLDSINTLINKYLNTKRKGVYANNQALQFLLSYYGPYWYRGMVEEVDQNQLPVEEVNRILSTYGANHIVVGHTFKQSVKLFYGGKVVCTDVPFYLPDGCPIQALLLKEGKFVLLNSQGEAKEFSLQ